MSVEELEQECDALAAEMQAMLAEQKRFREEGPKLRGKIQDLTRRIAVAREVEAALAAREAVVAEAITEEEGKPMSELSDFLKLMVQIAPAAADLIHQTVDAWEGTDAAKDALRREIAPSKFAQVDDAVDQRIEDLDLPKE